MANPGAACRSHPSRPGHRRDAARRRRSSAISSKLVDRFVCVSGEIAELSLAQGIAGSGLRTILNGIDVDRFRVGEPDPAGPIVTVARLSPEKDVANLIRATAIAAKSAPRMRVEIAGGGPCLEDLQLLVANLGVGDRITFLGEVNDVPAVFVRARMFVLPSRSEGIPLTVLESMACGVPVIATRVGGLPEVVEDQLTGLLVPSADPTALADAMLEIWNDPDRRDRMGRAGRRRAEEKFDVRRMVAEYEAIYSERAIGNAKSDAGSETTKTIPEKAALSSVVE